MSERKLESAPFETKLVCHKKEDFANMVLVEVPKIYDERAGLTKR